MTSRDIFPSELTIACTNSVFNRSSFLDWNIFVADGGVNTKLYNIRRDFHFHVVFIFANLKSNIASSQCRLKDKTKVLHGQTRYTTFLPHPSHPLHHSPSTLSAVNHLSVTVCRLGLSGIICRYQEQSSVKHLIIIIYDYLLIVNFFLSHASLR